MSFKLSEETQKLIGKDLYKGMQKIAQLRLEAVRKRGGKVVEVQYRIEKDRTAYIHTDAKIRSIEIPQNRLGGAEGLIAQKEECSTEDIFDWWLIASRGDK